MTLSPDEARDKVEAYFDKAQSERMDQESKRDTVLLAIMLRCLAQAQHRGGTVRSDEAETLVPRARN